MSGSQGVHVVADDPVLADALRAAAQRGGGKIVPLSEASALIGAVGPERLRDLRRSAPDLEWIQLGGAGVEAYSHLLDARLTWTSAKGAYAAPVAEHALALALGLLRRFPERARAQRWGVQAGTSLHGLRALVVGGGGIGTELVRLLRVFDTEITVVRRSSTAVVGADRTLPHNKLDDALAHTDILFLATALTAETRGLLDARRLGLLSHNVIIVNVARGGLIDTDALASALREGRIGGAGLDVTDPEPLPSGHALWDEPRALITPHTADTPEMIRVMLSARIEDNVRRWNSGRPLIGMVDPVLGY